MGFLPFFILLYHLSALPKASCSKIPPTQQCADEKCTVKFGQAKTVLRYIADDPRVLSFVAGEDIALYSKAQDYYGAKIRGRFGYVPKTFVRESKILVKDLPYTVSTSAEDTVSAGDDVSAETPSSVPVGAASVADDYHTPLDTLQQIEKLTQAYLQQQQKIEVLDDQSVHEPPEAGVDVHASSAVEIQPSVPVKVAPDLSFFTTPLSDQDIASTNSIPIPVSSEDIDVLSSTVIPESSSHDLDKAIQAPAGEEKSILSPHEKLSLDPYVNSNIVENTYLSDVSELLGAASKDVPVILEDFSNNLNVNFHETGFKEPDASHNVVDEEVQAKLEELVIESAEAVYNSSFLTEESNITDGQLDKEMPERVFGIDDIKPLMTTVDSNLNEGSSEEEFAESGEDLEGEDIEDEVDDGLDQDQELEEEMEVEPTVKEEIVTEPPTAEVVVENLPPASSLGEVEASQNELLSEEKVEDQDQVDHSGKIEETMGRIEEPSVLLASPPSMDELEKQAETVSATSAGEVEVPQSEPPSVEKVEESAQEDHFTQTEEATGHIEEPPVLLASPPSMEEQEQQAETIETTEEEASDMGNTEEGGFLSKLTSFFSSDVPAGNTVVVPDEPAKDVQVGSEPGAAGAQEEIKDFGNSLEHALSKIPDDSATEVMKESEVVQQVQEDLVEQVILSENLQNVQDAVPAMPDTSVDVLPELSVPEGGADGLKEKTDEYVQHVASHVHDHKHVHDVDDGHGHLHDQHDYRPSHGHIGHGHSHNHVGHGHSHNHHGHGHSHNHHGHGHSHRHHGHGHSHNHGHGHSHSPKDDHDHDHFDSKVLLGNSHAHVPNGAVPEPDDHVREANLGSDALKYPEPVIPVDVDLEVEKALETPSAAVPLDELTGSPLASESVNQKPPESPDSVTTESSWSSTAAEPHDKVVAPDGYCDADDQLCRTVSSGIPGSRSLLEDVPFEEEPYTPEEPGMLSDVLLPPRAELVAILTSVGIVVAIFLILSQLVKACAGRAKLVERVNRVEGQLVLSLEQISCLQTERSKFKGKETELKSKLLVAEESCKELGEKAQVLEAEKAKEAAAKKELEKKFEDVVQVSNEQGTMQAELLAMQEELLQQKAELESLLQSKEEECDHYRREATEVRELLSSLELQLTSATEKSSQFEAAEGKCAQLLNEKFELQISLQNLREENTVLQSSLIEKASEAQSLRVVLERVESGGGSLPSGSLDDLMDSAKIKAELDSTREECENLKNQLATLSKEHAESQRITEELRTTVEKLDGELATATEERNKAEDSLKILTDFFEKQKKDLAEKLKLYEDTKGNSASLIKKFENELELAKSEVGSLQAQVEMYKKALEEQERSLKAEIKAETQRSVEAQLNTKNWQRRCEAALREAADLRRRVTELTALNESASRNASMTGSENDLPHLNGGLDVLPPPPFAFPHGMPFPPFPEGMPPLPLDPSLMERPTTLGMRSPPFGQPYYEDRGTPNSFRAYSPRSRSPSGSERSEDFRRYRDYRPESVGRSRDPSPLRDYDRRRRDRTPPRHRV